MTNPANETDLSHGGYAKVGLSAIAIVFGGFGVWASFAPLDSAAIATAKVAVESDRKPVQHLEGGIVREILVKENEMVKRNQILFRLQPVQAQANSDLLKKQKDASKALEARLLAERDGKSRIRFPKTLLKRQAIVETATAIIGQERQFFERRRSLQNEVAILQTKIEQTTRDIAGRSLRLQSMFSQISSFDIELRRVGPAARKGYYPRNKLLALKRERDRAKGELALNRGEINRLRESITESRLKIRQTRQRHREEVTQQLGEARIRLSDISERLLIAEDVLTRVEVRAPKDGVVQDIQVQAIGAVIKPGAKLAEVVPVGDDLVMAAQISPVDIDSVSIGLQAEIRFPAFSSAATPTILGKITSLSADSIFDEVRKESFYRAKIIIDRSTISNELAKRLVPGMPADVLVSTGERTMLQYLLNPLTRALSKTFREK